MTALAQADQILDHQSQLDAKEMPKPWMYLAPWTLKAHFAALAEKRKNPGSAETDWDDEDLYERNELVPDHWR